MSDLGGISAPNILVPQISFKVSIIVSTINRPSLIECLNSIRQLDGYDGYETILVSTEEELPISLLGNEKLIHNKDGSSVAGKNLGGIEATNDILVFIDDDTIVPPDLLSKLMRHFQNPLVAVVGVPNLTPPTSGFLERCIGYVHSSCFGSSVMARRYYLAPMNKDSDELELQGTGILIRKSAFEKVGGYRILGSCSENDLFKRLKEDGYILIYTAETFVYHHRRKSISKFFLQILRSGNGRVQYLKFHPYDLIFKPFLIMPILFALYVLLLPFFALTSTSFILPLLLYFAGAFIASIKPALKEGKLKTLLLLPFLFFIQHMAYAIGFLLGISGHQIKKWS